jgi:hypothetical protein
MTWALVRMDGEGAVKNLLETKQEEGRRKRIRRIRWIGDVEST